MRGGLCREVSIATSHKTSDVLLVPLSTVILSELKIAASFFLSAEQFESHSCPIETRLVILRFVYALICVAVDGNIGRGRCPESVG